MSIYIIRIVGIIFGGTVGGYLSGKLGEYWLIHNKKAIEPNKDNLDIKSVNQNINFDDIIEKNKLEEDITKNKLKVIIENKLENDIKNKLSHDPDIDIFQYEMNYYTLDNNKINDVNDVNDVNYEDEDDKEFIEKTKYKDYYKNEQLCINDSIYDNDFYDIYMRIF